MMSLIGSAIIGLIAGALAKLIMPGKDPGGIFVTMLIGIVGSIVFTYLGGFIGWFQGDGLVNFIPAFLGAIFLLWIYRLIKGRGAAKAIKD